MPIPVAPASPPPPAALPAGTVTFLFTDIEGSTRLWEQHPTAMQRALARHDALLRQVIAAHQGLMVKGTGDGLHAAFARAPDAVAAVLAAQHTLRSADWGALGAILVRMALHTGAAEERDGDYFGPPLNRAARLLATGHGGQVLLSRATAELVREDMPPGVSLRDLGEHRLKDLARSEQIFQLLAPDLPSTFPPLRTRDAAHSNLPTQTTPLIGREQELAQVTVLLARADVRLITLTGPGGTGKTRLVLQLAADLADTYRDGVVFVDLAPLAAADQVLLTVAQVLGVKELVGTTLQARVCEHLQPKHVLLLLDNFEQVLDAAPLVAALLRAAPHLCVLVTSRVVLRLSGEHEYAVPPLALPPTSDDRPPTTDAARMPIVNGQPSMVGQYAAVQLFVARAQAVQPAFVLTEANAASVAAICRRLDGLPLAIELAAAWIKLFNPAALLARLSDRLSLLTGGARDLPERQQALRATIDWSYNLLAPAEQRLFVRLAVFVGGWALEAAEEVLRTEGRGLSDGTIDSVLSPQPSVLDGLRALVDHSLIRQAVGSDGAPRFRRLETIREYARELLAANEEEQDTLRQKHALYYTELAEQAYPQAYGSEPGAWHDRLTADYDNLRAALAWSVSASERAPIALRLTAALLVFWLNRGPLDEGLRWIKRALALPWRAELRDARAAALNAAGRVAIDTNELDVAEQFLAESLALYEQLEDLRSRSEVLSHLGDVQQRRGDLDRAVSYQQASLRAAEAAGSRDRAGWALASLGLIRAVQGQLEEAIMLMDLGLAAFDEIRDANGRASSLFMKGYIRWQGGDADGATMLIIESQRVAREKVGDMASEIWPLQLLAEIACAQGRYTEAHALLEQSLTLAQGYGREQDVALTYYGLCLLTLARGDADKAQAHLQASLNRLHALGDTWNDVGMLVSGAVALGAGQFLMSRKHYSAYLASPQASGAIPAQRNAALAVALTGLATALALESEGNSLYAARLWGASAQAYTSRCAIPFGFSQLSVPDLNQALVQGAQDTTRIALGTIAFAAAWVAGQALTLEQAVEEALALAADSPAPESGSAQA